jgi:hypothetical protein
MRAMHGVSSLVAAVSLVGMPLATTAVVLSGGGETDAVPQMERSAPVMLAGMLLLDDSILPDEDQTGDVTNSEDSNKAPQDKATARGGAGATSTQQVGQVTNSQVTGQVQARAMADNVQQSQAGRRSQQVLGVGSVRDTRVTGTVRLNGQIHGGNQSQGGESNDQNMSVGGVR